MNKKTLIAIVIALVVLLIGAGILYQTLAKKEAPDALATMPPKQTEPAMEEATGTQTEAVEEQKMMAPDFTAYDLDGNEMKLSDYFGKPIVLNFWASWCGPCKMEMPEFQKVYEEMGEEVQFLLVNMTGGRETLEKASSFIEKQGYTFPVFYDTEYDAAATYGVRSLPTTYFLDKEGYLVAQARGAINSETLQTGIDMITE